MHSKRTKSMKPAAHWLCVTSTRSRGSVSEAREPEGGTLAVHQCTIDDALMPTEPGMKFVWQCEASTKVNRIIDEVNRVNKMNYSFHTSVQELVCILFCLRGSCTSRACALYWALYEFTSQTCVWLFVQSQCCPLATRLCWLVLRTTSRRSRDEIG